MTRRSTASFFVDPGRTDGIIYYFETEDKNPVILIAGRVIFGVFSMSNSSLIVLSRVKSNETTGSQLFRIDKFCGNEKAETWAPGETNRPDTEPLDPANRL